MEFLLSHSLLLSLLFGILLISDTIRDDHVPSVPIALYRVQLSARFYDLDQFARYPIFWVIFGFLQDEVYRRHEEKLHKEDTKWYIWWSLHAGFG